MKQIAVSQFKTHCLSVIAEVGDTGEPVALTRRGKVIAKLFPAADPVKKKLGKMKGILHDDLTGPIVHPEEWAAFD